MPTLLRSAPPRAPGLGAYLAGLVVLAVLPLILAATLAMTGIARRTDHAFLAAREQVALALALALDSQVERMKPLLRSLSRAPAARGVGGPDQLAELHEQLVRLGAELDTALWLQGSDPEAPWLLASTLPAGAVPPGPLPADLAALRGRAEASGDAELDDLIDRSPLLGRPVARLVMPVYREDGSRGAVGILLPPESFRRILATHHFAPGEFATLVDGSARIVASSEGHERKLGTTHAAWGPVVAGNARSGSVAGHAVDGTPLLISYARLPHTPRWVVGVATPEASYLANRRRPWVIFGLGSLTSVGIAALSGMLLSRRLLRPLARVTAQAEAAAAGQPLLPMPGGGARVDEFQRLESAVARSHARLEAEARDAQQHEALLEAVTESSTDAIFAKDLDGRYRLANQAAAAALGHPRDRVLGRTDAELVPMAAATFSASDREVLASGRPGTFEERVEDETGALLRAWQAAKAPWRDGASGAIMGVVGVSRDVTERLANEARLRDSERSLQTLARRATISAMASGMAHELSQPLAAATNYLHVAATLAEREGSGVLSPLRLGQEQVVRAGEILRQTRYFLRRDDAGRAPSSVPELVESAVNLVLGGLETAPPLLDFKADAALPPLSVNAVQVQQVVVNLVRNACEAMAELPEGLARRLSITVAGRAEGGVDVTIGDTGPGLPDEIAATLFEPFRSTKPGGSGIGLAICRAIVESHGGRIILARGAAGGTEAHFTLPAPAAPDEDEAE